MYDVIIVGSGLSALSFIVALNENKKILVFTKDEVVMNNSMLAQGGICYSNEENDAGEGHISDTYDSGVKMGDRKIIRQMIEKSHPLIKKFIDEGMDFDRTSDDKLRYGLEGAHSIPRILHAGGDRTGRKMTEFFLKRLKNRHIDIQQGHTVIDIKKDDNGAASGVTAIDSEGNAHHYKSLNTVLATGGYSGMFKTNSGASKTMGSGHILSLRAGCMLRHMEMVQFHPTLLGTRSGTYGLVSEAVRGNGGTLINEAGERIMEDIHPLKDLAPRDVTSMAVYRQESNGSQCYLDISNVENFEERFPGIDASAKQYFPNELAEGKIPVTTGAHYTMGGVIADVDGSTDIPRLKVIGETASTNFHGANRLASNSLLEAVVMGSEAAVSIDEKAPSEPGNTVSTIPMIPYIEPDVFEEIKKEAMDVLGFERSESELNSLLIKIRTILDDSYIRTVSLANWHRYSEALTVYSMLLGCIHRKESRGCHNRKDFPDNDEYYRNMEIRIQMEGESLIAECIENQREIKKLLY